MVRRGRSPGRAGLGDPGRQKSPQGLGFGPCHSPSSISCQAKSLGTPHPCKSVHESSSSICPAPRDECGGLHIPPVSQQQAQMSPPEWLGQGVGQAGPGSVCGQREAEQERRHLGSARPSADRCSWDTWLERGWHCPLGTATSSPAPGLLTIPAAAAPGLASGRSSCQIHRC